MGGWAFGAQKLGCKTTVFVDPAGLWQKTVQSKETTKKKAKKTITKLQKVKRLKAPKKTKQRIAVGSGLSCIQYGAQTLQLAKHELTKLRTATTQAIGIRGSGVNPKLACNVARRVDPQFRIIWYAIHSWKRYSQLSPNRLSTWATTPIDLTASKRTHIGPIRQLASSCNKWDGR